MNYKDNMIKFQDKLSIYACPDSKAIRLHNEDADFRTPFFRDTDRIIYSLSYTRYLDKTQVFSNNDNTNISKRIIHVQLVSKIARTIGRALNLNEDLIEAAALGHDLGHTPFGHIGEKALDDVSECGFKHYEQSLRVVDKLEKFSKGLNLTYEVRDGILNHTKGQQPCTLEGQLVRICDRLAYINHDIDDALRADILSFSDFPKSIRDVLGFKDGFKIDPFFKSLIENSKDGRLCMSKEIENVFTELHSFMYTFVYTGSKAKLEDEKIMDFIKFLYEYLLKRVDKWPEDIKIIAEEEGAHRAICDYISCMTDRFAVNIFKDAFIPKSWSMARDF